MRPWDQRKVTWETVRLSPEFYWIQCSQCECVLFTLQSKDPFSSLHTKEIMKILRKCNCSTIYIFPHPASNLLWPILFCSRESVLNSQQPCNKASWPWEDYLSLWIKFLKIHFLFHISKWFCEALLLSRILNKMLVAVVLVTKGDVSVCLLCPMTLCLHPCSLCDCSPYPDVGSLYAIAKGRITFVLFCA